MEVNVKGKKFPVNIVNEQLYLDQDLQEVDVSMISDKCISLIHNGKQTTALISQVDKENKTLSLIIDQQCYEVQIQDDLDLLLSRLGMTDMLTKKISNLTSPMPGLVLNVLVEPGQSVSKGDSLILLEAMKMENNLKASADGVVTEVHVEKGESVEKGYTLISFE